MGCTHPIEPVHLWQPPVCSTARKAKSADNQRANVEGRNDEETDGSGRRKWLKHAISNLIAGNRRSDLTRNSVQEPWEWGNDLVEKTYGRVLTDLSRPAVIAFELL